MTSSVVSGRVVIGDVVNGDEVTSRVVSGRVVTGLVVNGDVVTSSVVNGDEVTIRFTTDNVSINCSSF